MPNQQTVPTDWNDFVEDMNEQFMAAMEQNMEAQASFVEQWSEAVEATISAGKVTYDLERQREDAEKLATSEFADEVVDTIHDLA